MRAKIYKGKPYGAVFTKAEQDAMRKEIDRELKKALDKTAADLDAMVLLILHEKFGFGAKRLKRFHAAYQSKCVELKDFYSLREQDEIWYAVKLLKEYGLDIDSLAGDDL